MRGGSRAPCTGLPAGPRPDPAPKPAAGDQARGLHDGSRGLRLAARAQGPPAEAGGDRGDRRAGRRTRAATAEVLA